AITLTVVLVLLFVVSLRLQSHMDHTLTDSLHGNALLICQILMDPWQSGTPSEVAHGTRRLADEMGLRITVIDTQGVVLADSEKQATTMGSHADRPEVVQALAEGWGQARHYSQELGRNMKYVAVRATVTEKTLGVVRVAMPLAAVQMQMEPIYRIVLLGAFIALMIAFVLAFFLSRSITAPIIKMREAAGRMAQGDFNTQIEITGGGELAALADSLNRMTDGMRAQLEELRRLDRVRTDFVANVSHELKTPLTLIIGYIETLQTKEVDPERAQRFMAIMSEHAQRLSHIVDDLLSLSEMDSGRQREDRGTCDLKGLVDDIVAGFDHAVIARGHCLDVQATGTCFVVHGDRAKFEQVFVNLLDNAIKYTPDQGRIEVHLTDQEDQVEIVVRDSGIGIEKKHLDRVFERFYRVDKARSRKLGGTGLGLGIAHHIVQSHGGQLTLDSEFGTGTTVTVVLPRRSP
ncbi:ATP-binding protein, partial [Planctomycetota bacterium]